jgi:hypothetical protein
MSPASSLALGFALILAGFLVPFLMVLQVLESGLVLSISAYCASLVGLGFSLYGVSHYSSSRGRDNGCRVRLRQ